MQFTLITTAFSLAATVTVRPSSPANLALKASLSSPDS